MTKNSSAAKIGLLLTCVAASCVKTDPEPTISPQQPACSARLVGDEPKALTLAGEKDASELTFVDDILPILSSNDQPRRYRCTVCHSFYQTIDGFDTQAEVDEALAAIADDMPRGGNPVDAKDIAIIKAWAKAGFAADKEALKQKAAVPEEDPVSSKSPVTPTPTPAQPTTKRPKNCS
jgi:hypothetical protein